MPGHVYQVNGQSQLLRNGVILAEDVEDLQFALFFDVDDDGVTDFLASIAGHDEETLERTREFLLAIKDDLN